MSLQSSAEANANHQRFVERVRANGRVWGLRSTAGWAECPSNHDDGVNVLVFWSDRAYAARHACDEWAQYEPTAISLQDFIEKWLPGIAKDGMLVGTNWDATLCGLESSPAELALQLSAAAK